MTAGEKIREIRALFAEELRCYPGDDAMRIIGKVLDIITDDPPPGSASMDVNTTTGSMP